MNDLIAALRALSRHENSDSSLGDDAADELERQFNNAAILAQQVADLRTALERLWDECTQERPSHLSDYEQGYLDGIAAAIEVTKPAA
jgi:hypothetical protein